MPLTPEQKQMIENNISLARFTANKCVKRYGLSPEDAVSVCYYGLVRAAIGFDPDKGFRFSTYAVRTMQCHVLKEMNPRKPQINALYFEEIFNGNGEAKWQDVISDTCDSIEDTIIYGILAEQIIQQIDKSSFTPLTKRILHAHIANPELGQSRIAEIVGCSQVQVGRAYGIAKKRLKPLICAI